MPSFEDIQDYGPETLTEGERSYIRMILGMKGTAGTSEYTDLESRFDALSGPQNQEARGWIAAYGPVSEGRQELKGGADGFNLNFPQQRRQIRAEVRRLLGYEAETEPPADGDLSMLTIPLSGLYGCGGSEY